MYIYVQGRSRTFSATLFSCIRPKTFNFIWNPYRQVQSACNDSTLVGRFSWKCFVKSYVHINKVALVWVGSTYIYISFFTLLFGAATSFCCDIILNVGCDNFLLLLQLSGIVRRRRRRRRRKKVMYELVKVLAKKGVARQKLTDSAAIALRLVTGFFNVSLYIVR